MAVACSTQGHARPRKVNRGVPRLLCVSRAQAVQLVTKSDENSGETFLSLIEILVVGKRNIYDLIKVVS